MDTVFTIPELRVMIARAADDKKTLSVIAQVGKAFHEAALDVLWLDLDSIMPLVLLLGPVVSRFRQNPFSTGKEDSWHYQDPYFSSEKWTRFTHYNHRIKRLRISLSDSVQFQNQGSHPFSPFLLSLINATRPFHGALLPNLRSVVTSGRTIGAFIHTFPFLTENVSHLELAVYNSENAIMGYALREFLRRLPNLKTISLESDGDARRFTSELIGFAKALQRSKVTEITLPRHFLTTNGLSELSHVESLRKISTHHHGTPVGVASSLSSAILRPGGFSELVKLSLTQPLHAVLPLITAKNRTPVLEEIEIWSKTTTNADLEAFSNAVAQARPNITSLRLDLFNPSPHPAVSLEFKSLLPLLECRSMTFLSVRHRQAIWMDQDDLKILLDHWPNLVGLSITADPIANQGVNQPYSGLPIDTLDLFAQTCPNIEHIGLFLDTSTPPTWSPNLRLERLRVLHVGWANPVHPHEIALYLSGLCDYSVSFLIGDSPINPYVNSGQTSPYVSQWLEVERLFRMLSRQRQRMLAEATVRQTEVKPGWIQRVKVEEITQNMPRR